MVNDGGNARQRYERFERPSAVDSWWSGRTRWSARATGTRQRRGAMTAFVQSDRAKHFFFQRRGSGRSRRTCGGMFGVP
ncbi:hypothetical protein N9M16_02695 [Candidatus Dependentiae bacterium]|nr:hypothetical protein [Candidatus Dependentiae bacterium]